MQLVSPTPEQWVQLSWLVAHLWLMVIVILGTAACYIFAHGIIPSLVYTSEFPEAVARRVRPALYAGVAVGLLVTAIVAASAVYRALNLLPDLYPRLAI